MFLSSSFYVVQELSLFQCFSSSLRLFLNSLFEHLWLLLHVNNKSCLFLCPLFILFRWGLLIEQVFLVLLQASCCVTNGSIPRTGHTCVDCTFLSDNHNWQAQNVRYSPRVCWSLVAEGYIVFFLSPLVCANMLVLTNLSRAVAWTHALFCGCPWCLICWHTSWLACTHPAYWAWFWE